MNACTWALCLLSFTLLPRAQTVQGGDFGIRLGRGPLAESMKHNLLDSNDGNSR